MDRSDTDMYRIGFKNGKGASSARQVKEKDITNQQLRNGHARDQALDGIKDMHAQAVPVIDYVSHGRVVIFADIVKSQKIIEKIIELQRHGLRVEAIVDSNSGKTRIEGFDIPVVCAQIAEVDGYLGSFDVTIRSAAGRLMPLQELLPESDQSIDIIIDLLDSPHHDAQVPPPGYFYAGNLKGSLNSPGNRADDTATDRDHAAKLNDLLENLSGMVGEFDKPRFFSYNPNICVHDRAGKTACTRCIDACPTLAITSLGENIEVNPYLCQGGGSCASACPSGAIRYTYPPLEHVLTTVMTLLKTYRANHGTNPRIVFYESAADEVVQQAFDSPACQNILPLMMEEVGAVGMEVTLASLAYGAQQVILICEETTPHRISQTLQGQTELANRFLEAMGYAGRAVVLCSTREVHSVLAGSVPTINTGQRGPANFIALDDKRTMIYRALEHLNQIAPDPQQVLPLPEQAPFGSVDVNQATCTLCMACASVCPMQALQAGGEQPRLKFIEDNCVQCGLCKQTCPEQAISLERRFVFSSTQRKQARVLNEEQPFPCIRCGKPFTTRRMIDHMTEKLAGHWMFKDQNALNRLKMCENCRVEDMVVTHEKMH